MILKNVKMRNIRSYTDAEIEFPEGAVLLSGDIGSGKSTILLAIDFALFGLRRGELSGGSILRHGSAYGEVEVAFELDKNKVVIGRTLKRGKDSVVQDKSWIELNGLKKELSPTELRAKVVELLGYPESEISGKTLIYKYTVYTPQEQMQEIMLGDAEERLNVMRKVFSIDKYEKIKENVSIALKHIRAKKYALQEIVKDEGAKKEMRDKIKEETSETEKKISAQNKKIQEVVSKITEGKDRLESLQKTIDLVNEMKQQSKEQQTIYSETKVRLENMERDIENSKSRIFQLNEAKDRLPELVDLKDSNVLKVMINEREKNLSELTSRKAMLMSSVASLTNIYDKGKCSVCRQPVANPEKFKKDIDDMRAQLTDAEEKYRQTSMEVESLKKEREYSEKLALAQKDHEKYGELMRREQEHIEELKNISKELTAQNVKREADLKALFGKIKNYDDVSNRYKEAQEKLEELTKAKENLIKEKASSEQRIKDLNEQVSFLDRELWEREKQKKQIETYSLFENWSNELFTNLMSTIEKHVMTNIQKEFNLLFQQWFNMLVPDENLSVQIDDQFSPIITQNGFDTEYLYLSGGEKTATALAYRLALNKVINNLIESIKTKDIIILDEPTDGFSTEQMDSLRTVLQELGSRQTIIVSHESKVETFVDHIIRFQKENHISKIINW